MDYCTYYCKEKAKRELVEKGIYLVAKGILKPQDDDKLFTALDELFDIPNNRKEETYESIISKLRGGD